MLKTTSLKFAKSRPAGVAEAGKGQRAQARHGRSWPNPARAFGPKMTALAGICASYLQPLDSVERWSILD